MTKKQFISGDSNGIKRLQEIIQKNRQKRVAELFEKKEESIQGPVLIRSHLYIH
jgi:hypothetical protein